MGLANPNFVTFGACYFRADNGHWVALDGHNRVYLSYDDGRVFHSDLFSRGLLPGDTAGPISLRFTMSRREHLTTYRWEQKLWSLGTLLVLDGEEVGIPYRPHRDGDGKSNGLKRVVTFQRKKYEVDVAALDAVGHNVASLIHNADGDFRALGVLVCGGRAFVKTKLDRDFFIVFNYHLLPVGLGLLSWTTQSVCGQRP